MYQKVIITKTAQCVKNELNNTQKTLLDEAFEEALLSGKNPWDELKDPEITFEINGEVSTSLNLLVSLANTIVKPT